MEKLADEDPTIAAINRLITILFIIIETSPVLVKTLSGKGSYDLLLEKQQSHEVYQGYLRDRKEEKLHQAKSVLNDYFQSIINFEREVAKHKEKYLRAKEKSKENIHSRNVKNIREDIDRQHDREILRFFDFCDRELENYLEVISNEMKDYPNLVRDLNYKIADSTKSDRIIQHQINLQNSID